ncbi:MAG: hypothetical protein BWY89_01849 [Bacteroidetes bacterium ADurb.BinA012]|nr:MAG: hypothetical protein BWY89_01849 [Bacteroidetes bacterium ADurb.BinA012]
MLLFQVSGNAHGYNKNVIRILCHNKLAADNTVRKVCGYILRSAKLNIIIHVGSGQYREDGRAPNLHEYTGLGAFLFPLVRKKANFVFNIRSYLFSLFLLACQLPQPDKL